jgi:hypothetical protein
MGGSTGSMGDATALLKLTLFFLQIQTQQKLSFVD